MNHVMRIAVVALTFGALGACSGDDDSAEAPATAAARTSSAPVTTDEAATTEASETSAETTVVTSTTLAPTTTTAATTTTALTTTAPTTTARSFTPQEIWFFISSAYYAKYDEARQFLDRNGYLIPSKAYEFCAIMAPAVETFASEMAKVQWPAEAQDEAATLIASSAGDAGVLHRCAAAPNIDEAYTIFADNDWTTTLGIASGMKLALGLPLG